MLQRIYRGCAEARMYRCGQEYSQDGQACWEDEGHHQRAYHSTYVLRLWGTSIAWRALYPCLLDSQASALRQ